MAYMILFFLQNHNARPWFTWYCLFWQKHNARSWPTWYCFFDRITMPGHKLRDTVFSHNHNARPWFTWYCFFPQNRNARPWPTWCFFSNTVSILTLEVINWLWVGIFWGGAWWWVIPRVGQNQIFTVYTYGNLGRDWPEPYIYGVHTVFLAWKSPNIRRIYTVPANPTNVQSYIYIPYTVQCTVLANPTNVQSYRALYIYRAIGLIYI